MTSIIKINRLIFTLPLVLTLTAFSTLAYCESVVGFIVMKTAQEKLEEVTSLVEGSLMNCKQLVAQAHGSIVVVRLECNNMDDYKTAITESLLPLEHANQTAIWFDQSFE